MSSQRPFGKYSPSVKASYNPAVAPHDPVLTGRANTPHNRDPFLPRNPGAPTAPPPPIIEDTEGRQQDTADMLRRRRGRAASVLTDGNAGVPMTASKTLLGQ